jgi:AAA domain
VAGAYTPFSEKRERENGDSDASGQRQWPPIKEVAELIRDMPPMPKELIHGVLHQGCKVAVVGGSKSMKTWTLLDLALSVGNGAQWWGMKTTQADVLYINMELIEPVLARRLEAILKARRGLRSGGLSCWTLRGFKVGALDTFIRLNELLKERQFGLIILDPIYKLLGGKNENAAGDISALLADVEALAQQTGAAIAFGHHFSKGNQSGKESMDRASGSGVWARDPDTIISMTRHKEQDHFSVEFTLRNSPPIDPFVVGWECPLFVRDDKGLDPEELKEPKPLARGRKPKAEADVLLSALRAADHEGGLMRKDWISACSDIGISDATFARYVKDLEAQKKVFKSATNGRWQLTPTFAARHQNGDSE